MARANVPKFGNWESQDNTPYTVYFEKARKNRGGGKMINPNDPQENPDMFPNTDPSPAPAPAPKTKRAEHREVGPTPDHRPSRQEDGDFGQPPARNENTGQGNRAARYSKPSAGSEQSFERSPLHKVMGGKGSGSPASFDGKSHDSSYGTPGRSRLKPTVRGDESPDEGATVPRFGEWDDNDPQSAENFTGIFDKVREARNKEAGNVLGTPTRPSYGTQSQQANKPKKCCFPWW